ncbi:beta-lactamase/transpeptidase-like protein [Trichoderma velutinum]
MAASELEDDGFTRSSPESLGYSSPAILRFIDDAAASSVELHSFMLYAGNAIIAEAWWWPYQRNLPHVMHSATKSFLAVAVGLAIEEGYFGLGTTVASVFPEKMPPSTGDDDAVDGDSPSFLDQMTVEDLLTQTCGHAHGESGGTWRSIESSWIDKFMSMPVVHRPGTFFAYSSATSFMLSAIVTRTTGLSVSDYLEPRFFRPLGIRLAHWDMGPEGINPGGNGLSCLTVDFLKLGVLHLQKGMWKGKRILPEKWVQEATKAQRGNLYGYQWWIRKDGSYMASGMFGQLCFVWPELDAVLAVTAAVSRRAAALKEVVDRHIPGLLASRNKDAVGSQGPVDHFSSRLVDLQVVAELPSATKTPSQEIILTISKERYIAAPNEDGVLAFALDLSSAPQQCILRIDNRAGAHHISFSIDTWLESYTTSQVASLHHGYTWPQLRSVARGRWIGATMECLEVVLQLPETAFRDTILIRFSQSDRSIAKLERSVNVNSFASRRPPIFATILRKGDELSSPEFLSLAEKDRATTKFSTRETSIGELLDYRPARNVLEAVVPAFLSHPQLQEARNYSLDMVLSQASKGQVTSETMAELDRRLAGLTVPACL